MYVESSVLSHLASGTWAECYGSKNMWLWETAFSFVMYGKQKVRTSARPSVLSFFPSLWASGLWDSAAHTEGSWSLSRECSGKAVQRYPQACFPNPGAFKTINEITMLTVKRIFEGGGRRITNLSVT